MNKNDVLFKVKFTTKPSKYFQPVLTNNTVTVSADNVEDLEDNYLEDNNFEENNINIDNSLSVNVSDEDIDRQLKDEIAKYFSDEEVSGIDEKINIDENTDIEDSLFNDLDKGLTTYEEENSIDEYNNGYDLNENLTSKMDLPLSDSKDENDSLPENRVLESEFKGFKERLFLHASNAKKPVQICVNKPVFLMGSDYSKMDCVIRNNRYVSRCHAKIYYEADCYFIEDVGSLNGTYINGVKLAEGIKYKLETGDVINLADCKFGVNIK